MMMLYIRLLGPIAAAAVVAGSALAEAGGLTASTRLGRCGGETCLLVTGYRPDPAVAIRIAGHDVAVEGGRRWHTAVPLRAVQDWSAPAARSIAVEIAGDSGDTVLAPLPIGLLGHVTQLAFLDVTAHR